ncbi:hypothetical protein CRV00_13790 [Malaciobacter molluscorum]|nr:hypothetical protein CRV00_13790 [Malaciobacter molluscorum]
MGELEMKIVYFIFLLFITSSFYMIPKYFQVNYITLNYCNEQKKGIFKVKKEKYFLLEKYRKAVCNNINL